MTKRLALYTTYDFEPLPSNGLRLFLPMATVRCLTNPDQRLCPALARLLTERL